MLIGLKSEKRVPPHEPESWFQLRPALGAARLQRMREERVLGQSIALARLRAAQFGSGETDQRPRVTLLPVHDTDVRRDKGGNPLPEEGDEPIPEKEWSDAARRREGIRAMYSRFDMATAYTEIITGWSYEWQEGMDEGYKGARIGKEKPARYAIAVTRETVAALDEQTRVWLDNEVYDALPAEERPDSTGNS